MTEDNNHIEDNFRQDLEHLEVAPPAGLWERMEPAIDEINAEGRKYFARKRMLWGSLSAVLVSVGVLLYLYFDKETPKDSLAPRIEKQRLEGIQENLPSRVLPHEEIEAPKTTPQPETSPAIIQKESVEVPAPSSSSSVDNLQPETPTVNETRPTPATLEHTTASEVKEESGTQEANEPETATEPEEETSGNSFWDKHRPQNADTSRSLFKN